MDKQTDVDRMFSWLKTPQIKYREFGAEREVTDAVASWPALYTAAAQGSVAPKGPPPIGATRARARIALERSRFGAPEEMPTPGGLAAPADEAVPPPLSARQPMTPQPPAAPGHDESGQLLAKLGERLRAGRQPGAAAGRVPVAAPVNVRGDADGYAERMPEIAGMTHQAMDSRPLADRLGPAAPPRAARETVTHPAPIPSSRPPEPVRYGSEAPLPAAPLQPADAAAMMPPGPHSELSPAAQEELEAIAHERAQLASDRLRTRLEGAMSVNPRGEPSSSSPRPPITLPARSPLPMRSPPPMRPQTRLLAARDAVPSRGMSPRGPLVGAAHARSDERAGRRAEGGLGAVFARLGSGAVAPDALRSERESQSGLGSVFGRLR